MKRIISVLLATAFCLTMMAGCTNSSHTMNPAGETADPAGTQEVLEGKEVLNGKKVIFIGNSFTYYGKCVLEKSQKEYGLENRRISTAATARLIAVITALTIWST